VTLAALLLAACGGGGGGSEAEGQASANQIVELSTPEEKVVDERASVRLQPLAASDLATEGMAGGGCAFWAGDTMLLAATRSDAIVRVEGALRHLVQSAPHGPTGGFFEDRQLSVSVGRTDEAGAGAGTSGRWPARLTVTNRRAEIEQDLNGAWSCG
jgi:hypothetical protein